MKQTIIEEIKFKINKALKKISKFYDFENLNFDYVVEKRKNDIQCHTGN